MLSIESRIPPRPGIIEPESLQSAERLRTDSTKSPIIEVIEIKAPKRINFATEPVKMSFHKSQLKIPLKIEPKMPPQKPAMLLFGLAFIKPLLFFPKSTPKNHAKESQKNTIVKNMIKTGREFLRKVIRVKKVSKYPAYVIIEIDVIIWLFEFSKVLFKITSTARLIKIASTNTKST